MKQYIDNELRRQIALNNSKNKLSCYITVKYYYQNKDLTSNMQFTCCKTYIFASSIKDKLI